VVRLVRDRELDAYEVRYRVVRQRHDHGATGRVIGEGLMGHAGDSTISKSAADAPSTSAR